VQVSPDFVVSDPLWHGTPQPNDQRWRPSGAFVGSGDRLSSMQQGRNVVWWEKAREMGAEVNAQAIWATQDWEQDWYSAKDLKEMADAGVTPVVILYYFGDEISQEYVVEHYAAYRDWLQRVLARLAGDTMVLVVLEPEFNNTPPDGKHHVKEWKPFADLMIKAATEVRYHLPNARVGLCPGDYRSYDLNDILDRVSPYLDFLAFQELWAATRENDLTEDYEDVSDYAFLNTAYLSVVYDRPVLLAYLGVSSYTPAGVDEDWGAIQASVLENVARRWHQLSQAGMIGVLTFALYDDPNHEGYFGTAERYWGLLDRDGRPKPAFEAFRGLVTTVNASRRKD
jgi:hypothetical protein